jgi:hypothetical protein
MVDAPCEAFFARSTLLWPNRISVHDASVGAFIFIWALSGVVIAGSIAMIAALVAVKPISYRGIRVCFYTAAFATILGIAMWGAQSPLAFWARALVVGTGAALAAIALMAGLRWARSIETGAAAVAVQEKTLDPAATPAALPSPGRVIVDASVADKSGAMRGSMPPADAPAKQQGAATPGAPITSAPPSRFAAELDRLDEHAATIRVMKLYENREIIFSDIRSSIQEGRRIIAASEKADDSDWPNDYGAWRTDLKNVLDKNDQI